MYGTAQALRELTGIEPNDLQLVTEEELDLRLTTWLSGITALINRDRNRDYELDENGPATLVDNFLGTAGADLSTRSAASGQGWVTLSGAAVLDDKSALGSVDASLYEIDHLAEGFLQADVNVGSDGEQRSAGLVVNLTDVNNWTSVQLVRDDDGYSQWLVVKQNLATTITTLAVADVAVPAATDIRVRVGVTTDRMAVDVNGYRRIDLPYTHPAGAKGGIMLDDATIIRKLRGGNLKPVPAGLADVALRAAANVVMYALARRETPVIQIDDLQVAVIEERILTREIRSELRRFPAKPRFSMGIISG